MNAATHVISWDDFIAYTGEFTFTDTNGYVYSSSPDGFSIGKTIANARIELGSVSTNASYRNFYVANPTGGQIRFGSKQGVKLGINATSGMPQMPVVSGIPTGAPDGGEETSAEYLYDDINHRLWIRDFLTSTWYSTKLYNSTTIHPVVSIICNGISCTFTNDTLNTYTLTLSGTTGQTKVLNGVVSWDTSINYTGDWQLTDTSGYVTGSSANGFEVMKSSTGATVIIGATTSTNAYIANPSGGSMRVGSKTGVQLGVSATSGFPQIPTVAGTPTGTPLNADGTQAELAYDKTNKLLYAHDFATSAWYSTAGSGGAATSLACTASSGCITISGTGTSTGVSGGGTTWTNSALNAYAGKVQFTVTSAAIPAGSLTIAVPNSVLSGTTYSVFITSSSRFLGGCSYDTGGALNIACDVLTSIPTSTSIILSFWTVIMP